MLLAEVAAIQYDGSRRGQLLSSRASTGKSIHASGRAARARAAPTTSSASCGAAPEAGGGDALAGWSGARTKPPRREPPISARSERIPARRDGDGGAGEGDRRAAARRRWVGVAGGESVCAGLSSGWRKQAMSRRWRPSSERSSRTPRSPRAILSSLSSLAGTFSQGVACGQGGGPPWGLPAPLSPCDVVGGWWGKGNDWDLLRARAGERLAGAGSPRWAAGHGWLLSPARFV
jgi:hypothetical protein